MSRNWLTGLGRSTTSEHFSRDRRGRQRRRVLALEGLEDRALMTAMNYIVNSLGDSGTGSGRFGDLRYAITQADLNPGSTIAFYLNGTIQLGSMLPDLTADMTITGPGASKLTVRGGGASSNFSLLTVDSGTTARISGLTFTNGNAISVGGGGIVNQYGANLTVSGCTISNNTAVNDGHGDVIGGGIVNWGQMSIDDSTLAGNSMQGYGHGGGIYNVNEMTVSNCTFSGNSAYYGGGIANEEGGMTLDLLTIGRLIVSNSTFSGNSAAVGGGIDNRGYLSVNDTTISGNTTTSDNGGGGIDNYSGLLSPTVLNNTIVAGNLRKVNGEPSDVVGLPLAFTSRNNLIGTGGSGGLTNGVSGNLVGVSNPGLAALANYGGPTETVGLLSGSPAVDAGDNALAVDPFTGQPLTTDQRGAGFPRIFGRSVDIGAFEAMGPVVTATQLVVMIPPPAHVAVGFGFSLAVTAEDALGNVATTYNGPVTVALANNPSEATLGGTLTATAVNGIAWLSGLTLDKPGIGYTLQVNGGVLTPSTTGGFNATTQTETQLAVTTQPRQVTANAPFGLVVTAEDELGNVATTYNGPVTLALDHTSYGATLGGTLTVTAVNGVATFSGLTLDKVDPYYTIQASGGGLTPATSKTIKVVAGAATKLGIFSHPPAQITVGSDFDIVVIAEDAFGNEVFTYNGPITLALANNPGGATLSGTLTMNADGGAADFQNLALDKVGSGYTLQASGGGLIPATTGNIDVTADTILPSQNFVIGTDDMVYTHALDATGHPTGGYYQVAYGQVKDLAVARVKTVGDLNSVAFVIGTDDQVYDTLVSGAEGQYQSTAYGSVSSISAATLYSGNLVLFAVGTDHQLYEQKFSNNGYPTSVSYTKAAYGAFRSTVLTSDAAGDPLLYAIGQDGQVYGLRLDFSGTPFGGVFKMGYGSVNQLAVGSDAAHDPEIFVVGTDNYVYALKANSTGAPTTGYFGVGGPVKSISVGSEPSGNPLLFAIGTDSQVYAHRFTATGDVSGSFFNTTAGFMSSIAAGVASSGNPELFAVAAYDQQVYLAPFDSSGDSIGPFALTTQGAVKKVVVVLGLP